MRIIESKAASIARHRSAAKRNPHREVVSLQEVVPDDDGRQVHRSETTRELGHDPWPQTDLSHDLLAAAAEMPPELRDGFDRALEGERLPKRIRLAIKRYLEDKGLCAYLK